MDVGVEKCVSIEFKYAKSYYNLTDVVLGQVYFKVVRLPLASMELQIQRKETTGFPPNQTVDTEVLSRYELMDGAPVKGESMPIRVFLANLDLTPTYHNVNNMFSVTYHLHLVLIEEDGKRYFKQCEFKLWRKQPQPIKTSPDAPISVNTDCLAGSQETPYKGSDVNKPLPEVQPQQSEEPKEEIKEPVIEQPQQSIQEEPKEEVREEIKEEPKEEVKEKPKAIDISSFIQDDKQDDDNLF
ncbi:vacuolar sorting protein 26 putative [Entamoeba histolytica]|uniref:Vacuolar sorting protein 26 putative n=2 Tax=Entamoeba histolytica TaxID=5759 RepID=A0A175JM54_ENTHI|nr:vacuolar sorting protein 26 putative [Entamoeba histolytica]